MTFSLSTILHNMYIHFVKLCFTYFLVIAGSRYCSGYSRNLYKTFDGALYAFDGECTYLLYSDEVITVTISLSQCENTATCVKVRMLQLRDCMCWVSIFAPSRAEFTRGHRGQVPLGPPDQGAPLKSKNNAQI